MATELRNTELRNSEVRAVYGQDGPVTFAGLDGDTRPEVIASIQAAQQAVRNRMAHLSDKSLEAIARRTPYVLKGLVSALKYFGPDHPFYQSRLKEAMAGGYLEVPAQLRKIILISRPRKTVLV